MRSSQTSIRPDAEMNDKKLGQALSKLNSRTKLQSLLDFDERTNENRTPYLFDQNDIN